METTIERYVQGCQLLVFLLFFSKLEVCPERAGGGHVHVTLTLPLPITCTHAFSLHQVRLQQSLACWLFLRVPLPATPFCITEWRLAGIC